MNKKLVAAVLVAIFNLSRLQAQLAITEIAPAALSTNSLTGNTEGPDFWELSNFGTNAIDLTGYIFNDSDGVRDGDANSSVLSGVTIAPGESIILVQSDTLIATRDDFTNWWGATNLPANLQVLFYTGNGLSGSQGDSVWLWSPTAASDVDYVDRADFSVAADGHSFTYNSTNGAFGIFSSNGVAGAFKAATSDDEGSPGFTTGPVPLTITQQPSPTNQTVPAGSDAIFLVAAQGLPRPHFQWRFKGNPIDGAIQSTLTVTNAQLTNAGLYSVIVSNGLQTRVSSNAVLEVTTTPLPPAFTATPKGADAFVGQTVQFTAQANGSPSPSYRWLTNGVVLPGQTSPQLTLLNVQSNAAAIYTVVAYNSVDTNSASAELTVTAKPRLLITEVQSTGSSSPGGHQDWWELTSFDNRPINLKGWRVDDSSQSVAPNNAYVFTNDVTIRPGESVIFAESPVAGPPFTPADFRAWWGTNLPAGLQIVTYTGNGLGLSSGGDAVNVWNAVTLRGNELTERIAGVSFAFLPLGVSFVYDPENPPLGGVTAVYATNTINGASANGVFVAAQSGDIGSPGYLITPIHLTSAITNGGDLVLSWNSANNRNYTVEYRTDITETNWSTNSTLIGTDTNTTVIIPMTPDHRLYRVGAVIPFVSQP